MIKDTVKDLMNEDFPKKYNRVIEKNKHKYHEIWSDGSYVERIDQGGWGAVICSPEGVVTEYSGKIDPCKSSYQAEYLAIVNSLEKLPDNAFARIFCDCNTVVKSLTRVYNACYEESNFGIIDYYPEILEMLMPQIQRLRDIKVELVAGHSSNTLNNTADKLSKIYLVEYKKCLREHTKKGLNPAESTGTPRKKLLISDVSGPYIHEINDKLSKLGFELAAGEAKKVFKKIICENNLKRMLLDGFDIDIPEDDIVIQHAISLNIKKRNI